MLVRDKVMLIKSLFQKNSRFPKARWVEKLQPIYTKNIIKQLVILYTPN